MLLLDDDRDKEENMLVVDDCRDLLELLHWHHSKVDIPFNLLNVLIPF